MSDRGTGDPSHHGTGGGAHRGNRYTRSEHARAAVLEAADDLLVERGLAGVTIEGIAARAGVAKQTIYRWWPSKVHVLLEAFTEDAEEELPPVDTGDLHSDLRDHVRQLAHFLSATDAGAVFRALAGQAQHDPQIADQLRTGFGAHQRTRDRLVLQRAIDSGQLAADLDVDAAVDQLVGPVYYRVLVTGDPVTASFTDALVDRYVAGITRTDARRGTPATPRS